MPRPTVHDIAKEAGVSLATVDRVLNARPGVREKTIIRVNEAIHRLGYVRDLSAANLARQRDYTFVFVLPDSPTSFLRQMHGAIEEAAMRVALERTVLRILKVPAHDPHALVEALGKLDHDAVDGVAIFAPETPQSRDAVMHLKEKGVSVVALVSDLPISARDHFVGIDNVAAGRTAGVLLGRFVGARAASVLVVAGSMLARDHVERRLGFDEVMARDFPDLKPMPSMEAWDEADRVAALLDAALDATPDVAAIYSIGSGNRGMIDVLRRRGIARDLVVIAHELTPRARDALNEGVFDAVISQDVGHVIRSAIRVLRARSDGHDIIPSQERIGIDIFIRENLI